MLAATMTRTGTKSALYRKVNTTAHGVHHRFGGDFSADRRANSGKPQELVRKGMHGKVRRGLDYTPLFRFLLSKVGSAWAEVHAEALSRLDREEPIFWIVARDLAQASGYVRTGEATYFSGLYVDGDGRLKLVDPGIGPSSLQPLCPCCTHTFNGLRFTQPFDEQRVPGGSANRLA